MSYAGSEGAAGARIWRGATSLGASRRVLLAGLFLLAGLLSVGVLLPAAPRTRAYESLAAFGDRARAGVSRLSSSAGQYAHAPLDVRLRRFADQRRALQPGFVQRIWQVDRTTDLNDWQRGWRSLNPDWTHQVRPHLTVGTAS